MRKKLTVSFGHDTETTVLAESAAEAVERACVKLWGRGAWFHRDHGISHGLYGQVCKPIKSNPGCNNCLTGRVGVSITDTAGNNVDPLRDVPFGDPRFRVSGHRPRRT